MFVPAVVADAGRHVRPWHPNLSFWGLRKMMNSKHDLFFLRFEFPSALDGEFRWSLAMVKISDELPRAYLAFQTEVLAELAADALPNAAVVPASKLDASRYLDASTVKVVLFKSEGEIRDYMSNRQEYPYELSLYNYSPEYGLSRLTV
jgi:hypothetical protein